MRVRSKEYVVDWPHLVFLALITGGIGWYLLEARSVSLATNNLLLVQPLSLLGLGLCLFILPQCFRSADQAVDDAREEEDPLQPSQPKETKELLRIGVLGAALGAMIFSISYIGFDIGLWAFAVASMVLCGERRPIALLIYPLAVTIVTVYGFRALMPYPMETTIL